MRAEQRRNSRHEARSRTLSDLSMMASTIASRVISGLRPASMPRRLRRPRCRSPSCAAATGSAGGSWSSRRRSAPWARPASARAAAGRGPGGGELGVAGDGIGQRGPQLQAFPVLLAVERRAARRHGRWLAIQHGGERDGVRPAQPEAEPVGKGLSGFGNVDVRQASKQANERRAAETCAPRGLHHTTRAKKGSLHAGAAESGPQGGGGRMEREDA